MSRYVPVNRRSIVINRILYIFFVLSGVFFLLVRHDMGMAMSQLGLALIFDPFNPEITWRERRSWQKSWLLLHLASVFVLLFLVFFNK